MTKPRGHYVILDPRTIAGKYFSDWNDGFVVCGDFSCPVLICSKVSTCEPHGISVVHIQRDKTPPEIPLFLPTGSVALILDLPDKGQPPFGFSPAN